MPKISELAALTAVAAGDLLPLVDISDTSEAASGTTKRVTLTQIRGLGWLSVTSDYGADPTGSADATTAIQNALNACPAGGCVYLPQGTYKTSSPLTVPSGVRLQGCSRALGIPIGDYGIGGLALIGSIIKPSAAFSGAAVISMTSSASPQTGGQQFMSLTIDCTDLTGTPTVHGISITNGVAAVTMRDVLAYGGNGHSAGNGLYVTAGADANPDFIDVSHCKFSGWGGQGVHVSGLADSWFTAVEATGNTGDAWNITNGNNSRFLSCKGEGSSAGYGWNLTGNTGFTGKVYFTTCTSGSNVTGGWKVSGSGTGTYYLNGCTAIEATPWTYAGTMGVKSSAAWNTSTATPTLA